GRLAPKNFKTSALGIILGAPRNFRIRRHCPCELRIGWRSGSLCQLPQRFSIVARHVAHERKVEMLFEVSVLDPVFCARRLMLVVVVFEWFGEAHCRKPRLVKWIVIAAAAVAVDSKDH